MTRGWLRWVGGGVALAALGVLVVAGLNLQGEAPLQPDRPGQADPADAAQVQRGAYLARAGNCAACHTAPGGLPYAGGRPIATPFGAVLSTNLTPDPDTGLGRWSADEFWRALHHGRSRDGRLLVPAFPYPNFTRVTRADADDLLAWLRSLPPVHQVPPAQGLRGFYGSTAALAVWRALYFRPGGGAAEPEPDPAIARGAYLVEGLGHCSACHARRNLLGASAGLADGPDGGPLPQQRWRAPSLADPAQAGATAETAGALVQLLKTGITERSVAMGPMAEVVAESTQYLTDADLGAVARYLVTLSGATAAAPPAEHGAPAPPSVMERGRALYADLCSDCHGPQGQGAPGIYPPLAGNRSVTMADPRNLLQAITAGGFPPGTEGNPRPYGMPAFDLPHEDLAALATWLRASWGHQAAPVTAVEALKAR